MQFEMVYVTCKDDEQARSISRTIVSERLAACANILGKIDSYYWWDGKVQESAEVAVLFKTRGSLTQNIIARIKELHTYTVPCVVAIPMLDGNLDFLKWIEAETITPNPSTSSNSDSKPEL